MRRIRFHLSTALAVMLATGVMLGVNLRPSIGSSHYDETEKNFLTYYHRRMVILMGGPPEPTEDSFKFEYVSWGWPWQAYGGERFRVVPRHPLYEDSDSFAWNGTNAAGNAAVALALILVAGILCELILSRRKKRA